MLEQAAQRFMRDIKDLRKIHTLVHEKVVLLKYSHDFNRAMIFIRPCTRTHTWTSSTCTCTWTPRTCSHVIEKHVY